MPMRSRLHLRHINDQGNHLCMPIYASDTGTNCKYFAAKVFRRLILPSYNFTLHLTCKLFNRSIVHVTHGSSQRY